jgi:hypothetical protein
VFAAALTVGDQRAGSPLVGAVRKPSFIPIHSFFPVLASCLRALIRFGQSVWGLFCFLTPKMYAEHVAFDTGLAKQPDGQYGRGRFRCGYVSGWVVGTILLLNIS